MAREWKPHPAPLQGKGLPGGSLFCATVRPRHHLHRDASRWQGDPGALRARALPLRFRCGVPLGRPQATPVVRPPPSPGGRIARKVSVAGLPSHPLSNWHAEIALKFSTLILSSSQNVPQGVGGQLGLLAYGHPPWDEPDDCETRHEWRKRCRAAVPGVPFGNIKEAR